MEAYLEGNEPDIKTLKTCIRKEGHDCFQADPDDVRFRFQKQRCSATADAVVDFLPSPLDKGNCKGHEARFRCRIHAK